MLGAIASYILAKALKTLNFLAATLFFCLFAATMAHADEQNSAKSADMPVEALVSLNKRLVADLAPEFRVSLEGEELPSSEVRKDNSGAVFVRAEPIFEALNNKYEYNIDDGTLVVQRSQDGVVMELYTDTGIVKANGRALGKLDVFGEVREGMINLTPNAIAVLSGAIGKIDEDAKRIDFELDPRLKVATGFEVFVNDIPLGQIEPGPKSIGSVLLLPLRPIAQELGHEVQIIEGGSVVKVLRSQDSAVFELNLDTGLVKLNGRPHGVTKDVSYIEDINLLLPISAIETLTGTHINVEAGTSRINVDLDARLKGAIKPGSKISETTEKTPFVLETLEFHTGIDTLNKASVDFRMKGLNGRVRYEIPDLPTSIQEAEPSWLSLELAHVNGVQGTLGDYSADLRELDGVGIRRIRGIAATKNFEKGRWAIAGGVPSSGSKQVSEDQNRSTFDGFAAGARYADKDGWEAGVSYKKDGLTDDQMAVLSAISGRLGRKREKTLNWDVRADVGAFSGSAREKSADVRVSGNARYEVNKSINIDVFANYDGAEFLRTDLDGEEQSELNNPESALTSPETDEQAIPDIRARGKDFISYGAAAQVASYKDIGPFNRPAASIRYSRNESGVFTGQENKTTSQNYGASISTKFNPLDTNLSVDFNAFNQSGADGKKTSGDQITVRAYKDTKYATVRSQYSSTRGEGPRRLDRLDGQITVKPKELNLPKDALISVSPSVSGTWSDTNSFVRGGLLANLDSGRLLGKKTKLQANLGVLQSFSNTAEAKSDTFLTVSLGRQLRINKNLAAGLSYRTDLRGEQRVGIYLDGRFDFNEKRKFRNSDDGRGVLKGRVFLDKNRDGKKQEDEPGIGGAMIRVKGTRLALRTDSAGYYTIQNIKVGLYELQIEGRSLPLGYSLADEAITKATVGDGYITDVNMPVVRRGQVLGYAYVDENADGEHTKGEKRLEGAKLVLTDLANTKKRIEVYATSFGQFAFDNLAAGRYELQIDRTNQPGSTPDEPMTLDLAETEDLMLRVKIAAKPVAIVQLAERDSASVDGSVITGREEEIPPPDNPAP